MISLRPVGTEDDAAAWLRLRNAILPGDPVTAATFAGMRARPARLDLVGSLDGEDAGIGSVGELWGDPEGPAALANVRVLPERRRRGLGTALFRAVSEHARDHGHSELYTVVPAADGDTLGYLGRRGYRRVLEMQGVALDLATAAGVLPPDLPPGLRLAPLAPELDRAVYDAAGEVELDLRTAQPVVRVDFERWRRRALPPSTRRDLSFVVLDGDDVVAYALLEESPPRVGDHAFTGVRRAYRGRGLGLALKQAQVAAARVAGLRELRATNEVGNAPIRRVNDRLGYRRTSLFVHLQGPLL